MPQEVLTDALVIINSVDLSDHVKQVTIRYSKELHDMTVMGDTGRRRVAGLADWSADIEMNQNYDASKVDATIFPIVGTQVALRVRKSKASAISATNPEYQGNGIIPEYQAVGGSVGEPHSTSFSMQGSDGVALIRDVTP